MDKIVSLALQTIMVTPSGALSPGPLTIATMSIGVKSGWRGGALVALGHMLFEFPYILALTTMFSEVNRILSTSIGNVIAVAGVIIILYFAYMLLRDAAKGFNLATRKSHFYGNPIVVGFFFTALNVFFLLWWISIGMTLISTIASLGIFSILVMYPAHVWMDFLWLMAVAEATKKGSKLLSEKGYRVMLGFFGLLLIIFAVNIVLKRFAGLSIIP
ncbi:LysE family transporter [Ignisphaera sp. 4213-co]|uniref:LysE family transporter n=1 Tax=Ignisphaera cupida TaxID=3050454 RepID=A0ABD4ZA68_9CREN|nr:LysE family transporter [Ignisphaera sp. 4213-co]MDK6028988.1 LysE family transporter [Ignisphaera sp. 4213-co]